MTLPTTLSFVALALALPRLEKPSLFAKLGEHSGEIYMNHGVLNIMIMSMFWHMGVFSDPELRALVGSNLALQLLIVPLALTVNLAFYFGIRSFFRHYFNHQILTTYREAAMIVSALWLMFIFFPNEQGESLLLSKNAAWLVGAIGVCCAVYYSFIRLLVPTQILADNAIKPILVCIITSGYWIALHTSGMLDWLLSLYQREATPIVAVLSSPLVTISLLYLFSVGITLSLQQWVYKLHNNGNSIQVIH